MNESVVHYFGAQINKCGYCKGTNCATSHGMHGYVMTVADYQDLIDRGWRRCGLYCYKPNNKTTCCPSYAIRCDTETFTLSNSHKKVLKRMNRFLRDGKPEPQEIANVPVAENDETKVPLEIESTTDMPQTPIVKEPELEIAPQALPTVNASKRGQGTEPSHSQAKSIDNTSEKTKRDLNKPPLKKAKQMRLERHHAKLGLEEAAVQNKEPSVQTAKTLFDYITDTSPNDKHKLTGKMVEVNSREFAATIKQTYLLYQKYQTIVHKDPPQNEKAYLEFLQESPLRYEENYHRSGKLPEMGYGSFHQQYWLDDILIAVGVVDILPNCLSSVYFFYDPDYSFLSLGTYGSLREIDFVQRLSVRLPDLKYYYMGYYIHSCPKMRYKGNLNASYLLCPETYVWMTLTPGIRVKLEANKYQRLCLNPVTVDDYAFNASDLNDVTLLIHDSRERTTFGQYKQQAGDKDLRVSILEYGTLVGRKCAQNLRYLILLEE